MRSQIGRWADSSSVPYEPDPVEPTTDRFLESSLGDPVDCDPT